MMSEGMIDRLRHEMKKRPNSTVPVYAGDVIEAIDAIIARAEAAEAQLAEVRQYLDEAIGRHAPDVPLIDRIVVLVSMLAASSTTMPGLDDAVDNHTVDALARRVEALEGFAVTVNRAAAKQIEIEERDREQVRALQGIVRKLDDATAEQVARLIERVEAIAQRVRAEAGTNSTAFRNIDAAWRKMDARIAALEQTVANLQRLAQQTHGPEAGL